MSNLPSVYWIKGRSLSSDQSALSHMERIFGLEEMAKLMSQGKITALKINLSELGYDHYLPPFFVINMFQRIRDTGMIPMVTDSGSLFKGSRFSGYDWTKTALAQGFSIGDVFENRFLLAGGYTNEEGNTFECEGKHLGAVELGSLLTGSDNVVVMSHVTAHPLLGLGGAIYNLGLGFLTQSGKQRVHSCLELEYDEDRCDNCRTCISYCPTGALSEGPSKISFDPRICNGCLGCFISCPRGAMKVKPEGIPIFQESVVEAAYTARKNIKRGVFFINFLVSVTPQTDEYPFSDLPFVPDLGILASEDPVAVDWASYQMIIRSPGLPGSVVEDLNVLGKGQDKIKAITGVDTAHLMEYAEERNLGSRECEFFIST